MMRGRGQCPRPARWLTGPRLAGETGGALGLTPKSSVVTTAVIQAGARLPLMVAAWHAIAVSRPIAEAGTGTPGAAGVCPQPAAVSADASAAAPASTTPDRRPDRRPGRRAWWQAEHMESPP